MLTTLLLEQQVNCSIRLPFQTFDIPFLVRLSFLLHNLTSTLNFFSRHLERSHIILIPDFFLYFLVELDE